MGKKKLHVEIKYRPRLPRVSGGGKEREMGLVMEGQQEGGG
jgi:hypothetical protein